MSVLGTGDEFIILFFRDDIYFCTSVNFAINVCVSEGFTVTWISVMTLVRFFLCSIPAVVRSSTGARIQRGTLPLMFPGRLCHNLGIHSLHHQVGPSAGS